MLRRLTCTALVGAMLLAATGCQSNPYAADTWIEKLDDSNEAERAVTELEHLGDPKAIPALGKAWENSGCTQRIYQVMIDLAHPLTPAEAEKGNFVDLAQSGRKASWDDALPFLTEALGSGGKCAFDEASPRSLENAGKAADALGDAQTDAALQALIDALGQPYGAKGQAVRLSVILGLGKYKDARAVKALQGVLENSPETTPLPILAAAVNALAATKNPDATATLISTMYRVPPIFSQVRRALVAMGPGALAKLRAILRGEDQAVNQLFKDQKLDQYCGDKDPATGKIDKPITPCKPSSMKDFYAAIVLGDMYSPEAVPDLLAALKRPAQPAFYQGGAPTGSTQHNGIYDSLRKIGAAEGADQLKAIWSDTKADAQERVLAVGAYAFVARNGAGAAELGKIAGTDGVDDGLRQEAATAFARLATSEGDIAVLTALAAKYQKAADEARAKADGPPKAAYEKAKAAIDEAKKKLAAAKAKFNAEGGIKKASAETINAFTQAQKAVDELDEPFDNAKAEWKPLDNAARDYRGYQRLFETHIARIEIYLNCKDDAACYAKALDAKADTIAPRLAKWIKGVDQWTPEEKAGLVAAQIERALLELGKLGPKAEGQTGALLAKTSSEDRIVRQSVLLALPKIAKLPCTECEAKLDEAIKKSAGKSELAELNVETTVLRNYFGWAGKK